MKKKSRFHAEYDHFTPEVQQAINTSHSPVVKWLIYSVFFVFMTIIVLTAFIKVEQVVSGVGVVRPAGKVKIINHSEGGVIAEVYANEGGFVNKGQILAVLNTEMIEEEITKVKNSHEALKAQIIRLESEAEGKTPVFPTRIFEQNPNLVLMQKKLYIEREHVFKSKFQEASNQIRQNWSKVQVLEEQIRRKEASLRVLREQEEALSALADKGYFPKLRYLKLQGQIEDVLGEISTIHAEFKGAIAAWDGAKRRLERISQEWKAGILTELEEATRNKDKLAVTLRQLKSKLRKGYVRSPVSGVIQDVSITSAGQSVSANQELLKVVPIGDKLIIEAKVANDEIGYVSVGQKAMIKVMTFDFLKYGTLEGKVDQISADAVKDKDTGSLYFKVLIKTDKNYLGSEEKGYYRVHPGMLVNADLIIGKRTILSYLTDRVLQTTSGAFRER